jgi:hypothetical protein
MFYLCDKGVTIFTIFGSILDFSGNFLEEEYRLSTYTGNDTDADLPDPDRYALGSDPDPNPAK